MKKQSIRVIFDNYEVYKAKWEKKGYKLKRVDLEKRKGEQTYAIMQFIKEEDNEKE